LSPFFGTVCPLKKDREQDAAPFHFKTVTRYAEEDEEKIIDSCKKAELSAMAKMSGSLEMVRRRKVY
jgi:hypothetical protein